MINPRSFLKVSSEPVFKSVNPSQPNRRYDTVRDLRGTQKTGFFSRIYAAIVELGKIPSEKRKVWRELVQPYVIEFLHEIETSCAKIYVTIPS